MAWICTLPAVVPEPSRLTGPRSSTTTACPAAARWSAVAAPRMPAPTISTSLVWLRPATADQPSPLVRVSRLLTGTGFIRIRAAVPAGCGAGRRGGRRSEGEPALAALTRAHARSGAGFHAAYLAAPGRGGLADGPRRDAFA